MGVLVTLIVIIKLIFTYISTFSTEDLKINLLSM